MLFCLCALPIKRLTIALMEVSISRVTDSLYGVEGVHLMLFIVHWTCLYKRFLVRPSRGFSQFVINFGQRLHAADSIPRSDDDGMGYIIQINFFDSLAVLFGVAAATPSSDSRSLASSSSGIGGLLNPTRAYAF